MGGRATERRILRVRGTVQGVGFRPFVFRTAARLGLTGCVFNYPAGVVVDAEGEGDRLDELLRVLATDAPPHAQVEEIAVELAAPGGASDFTIADSRADRAGAVRVAPDLATCAACLAELADPADRRHGYPFINCTECGPRYSIVRDVPYDRCHTTMDRFAMCERCATEYDDPRSRRFHAQPNACPSCGPTLAAPDAILQAAAALRAGRVVAVKGLGGFHLACDATDERAVSLLRRRKGREDRPFAVMFADLDSVERFAVLDDDARRAVESSRRSIVLVPRRPGAPLAASLAAGLDEVGVFLPYTPLHLLLLAAAARPLVMTSGNRSDEPIAIDADDARARLADIADLFVLHDRPIHARVDDSVVRVVDGRERVLRRARGYVPDAIDLGVDAPPILAMGGDLKNALCLTSGRSAVLSQHIGDLAHLEAQEFHAEARAGLERLFRVRPTAVAHDLHPAYHSTAMARRTGLPMIAVQHHHAHIASCMVENGVSERVIGVAWDGTGHGPDGTVWGGEILVADLVGFERIGRIRPVPLAGGDAAVRHPWRMALAHAIEAGLPAATCAEQPERAQVEAMIRGGVATVRTSSAGRLFDAIASLAGVRHVASYEGQAAMELEAASRSGAAGPGYPFPVEDGPLLELDPRPLVAAVVEHRARGASAADIGARFHAACADAIAQACVRARARTGLEVVALSGGCFQNRLLSRSTEARLCAAGFVVHQHARVPPGDGGLALGQAAIAARRLRHVPGDPR